MTDADAQVQQDPQPNSPTLIIGPTGVGKTSLIATVADYVWRNYKKVLALYTLDGGGFPAMVQARIRKGLIRVWRCQTRGAAFETMDRATRGWWPQEIDPMTGETQPGVELVPPVSVRYDFRCPANHLMRSVRKLGPLTPMPCPTCKRAITTRELQVQAVHERSAGFDLIGAVAIDGFTSGQGWVLENLSERTGRGDLGGEKTGLGGVIVEGDYTAGGNNRAQIGFAQTRAEQWARNLMSIPGLVVPPLVTALTNETTDEAGLQVIGPKLAGQAKTDEAPQWFGNCLEAAVVKDEQGHDIRRLYLSEFVDRQGRRHLLKHRGIPGSLPPFLEDPADLDNTGEGAFSGFNLGHFFAALEESIQRTMHEIDREFPDAPGLPPATNRLQEVGREAVAVPVAAKPAPTQVAAVPSTGQLPPARVGPAPVAIVAPVVVATAPKPPKAPVAAAAKPKATPGKPVAKPQPAKPAVVSKAAPPPPLAPPPVPMVPQAPAGAVAPSGTVRAAPPPGRKPVPFNPRPSAPPAAEQ